MVALIGILSLMPILYLLTCSFSEMLRAVFQGVGISPPRFLPQKMFIALKTRLELENLGAESRKAMVEKSHLSISESNWSAALKVSKENGSHQLVF